MAVRVDDAEAGLVLLGPGAVDDLDEVQLADLGSRVSVAVRRPRGGLEVGPLPAAVLGPRGSAPSRTCRNFFPVRTSQRLAPLRFFSAATQYPLQASKLPSGEKSSEPAYG